MLDQIQIEGNCGGLIYCAILEDSGQRSFDVALHWSGLLRHAENGRLSGACLLAVIIAILRCESWETQCSRCRVPLVVFGLLFGGVLVITPGSCRFRAEKWSESEKGVGQLESSARSPCEYVGIAFSGALRLLLNLTHSTQ